MKTHLPRIAFAGLTALALAVVSGCWNKEEDKSTGSTSTTTTAPAAGDLQIHDSKVGGGAEAKAGQQVSVHYTGWLWVNGKKDKKFDSSVDRGQPFKFMLGAGQVIQGWDKGVAGMKVGGKRELTIPPQMGYGATGAGGLIPPNATLFFEVELLGVN